MLEEFGESIGDFLSTNIDQHTERMPQEKVAILPHDLFANRLPLSGETLKVIRTVLSLVGIPYNDVRVTDWLQNDREKHFFLAVGDQRYVLENEGLEVRVRRKPMTELSALITTQPIGLLSRWGAKLGNKRSIDALYRVRQCSKEATIIPRDRITTVGYPIFLTAHPSPFTDKYRAVRRDSNG